MAKKIRFALEMAGGYKARFELEEIQEHFDPVKAIEYFTSGKLMEWLKDRDYDEVAAKLTRLDKDAPDFQRQLYEVLNVKASNFLEEEIDVDVVVRSREKETLLRQKTSNQSVIDHAAQTAFDRKDLVSLWDAGEKTIYLCGEFFDISASVEKTKYIGVLGTPQITVNVRNQEELVERGIAFENVDLPEYLRANTAKARNPSAAMDENPPRDEKKEAIKNKFCAWCGKENIGSAKFCNGCGAVITNGLVHRRIIPSWKIKEIAVSCNLTPQWDVKGIAESSVGCNNIPSKIKQYILSSICKNEYCEADLVYIKTSIACMRALVLTLDSIITNMGDGFRVIDYADITGVILDGYHNGVMIHTINDQPYLAKDTERSVALCNFLSKVKDS